VNRLVCLISEAHPLAERWDAYLGHATVLRPELEWIDDFVDDAGSHSLHAYAATTGVWSVPSRQTRRFWSCERV